MPSIVCLFILIHKATPVDRPQLSYMVNKLHYSHVKSMFFLFHNKPLSTATSTDKAFVQT